MLFNIVPNQFATGLQRNESAVENRTAKVTDEREEKIDVGQDSVIMLVNDVLRAALVHFLRSVVP